MLAAGALALVPAAHAANPGGAEPEPPEPKGEPAPADAAPPTGGAPGTPAPRLTRLRCRVRCTGPTGVLPGATLDLRGRRIAGVDAVTFLGAEGEGDDLTVAPSRVTRKRILVAVPDLAASGPVAVASTDGAESAPSRRSLTVGAAEAGGPRLDVSVGAPTVFVDGTRRASVAFALRGGEPETVGVVLRREADGAVVASWDPGVVTPGVPRRFTWNGKADGRVQPPGRYAFEVTVLPREQARAASVQAPATESFELLDHQFPVRGAHRYGSGAAAFGGGRGHQGHDVFAACGTPLVAARGGRVKFKQFHSRAGHYLVVDGEESELDYAYMHLRDSALVDEGDRVRTGQPIGFVGETGRASGCHLHFELWSAPGWYEGGKPLDPLPLLRAWDAGS